MRFPPIRYLRVAVLLALFWLLLSGHYTLLLLSLGAGAVVLVVWFVWRMDRVDGEIDAIAPGLGLLRYGVWLAWSVVKSNIDVARRIWSPGMPIQPRWGWLDVRLVTPLQKTLYANSITLTPGTLTAEVREHRFLIHSLSEQGLDELRNGEMERQISSSGI